VKLLVFLGSLRSGSFTGKLAEALDGLSPEGVELERTDGRELPLYDQDLDGDEKPPAVRALRGQVTAADALVFVSPEFNYGIPGPLKNAIDWASRPAYRSPLRDKPALVISHSIAPTGGARAHAQLCAVLGGTATPVYHAPSLVIPQVHEKFDETGALGDDLTRLRLTKTLEDFAAWAARATRSD